MTKAALIKRTVKLLNTLPEDKAQEMADYIQFKQDEIELQTGIETLISTNDSFNFLYDDDDIYSVNDLKEKFNG
jgi:hypothetical protein